MRASEGPTISEVAARFGVGVASVVGRLKSPARKQTRTKKPPRSIWRRWSGMRANPFNMERAVRFGVSRRGIGQAPRRVGVTYKKTLAHPKANEDQRRGFQARIKAHEAAGRPIVYINESGFATDMARTHGHGPGGKRCLGRHGWRAAGRANVIGALVAGLLPTTLPCDFNTARTAIRSNGNGPGPKPSGQKPQNQQRKSAKQNFESKNNAQVISPISLITLAKFVDTQDFPSGAGFFRRNVPRVSSEEIGEGSFCRHRFAAGQNQVLLPRRPVLRLGFRLEHLGAPDR